MTTKQEWLEQTYKQAKERPVRFTTLSDMPVEPLYTVSPVDGIKRHAGSGVNVVYNDGADATGGSWTGCVGSCAKPAALASRSGNTHCGVRR